MIHFVLKNAAKVQLFFEVIYAKVDISNTSVTREIHA